MQTAAELAALVEGVWGAVTCYCCSCTKPWQEGWLLKC